QYYEVGECAFCLREKCITLLRGVPLGFRRGLFFRSLRSSLLHGGFAAGLFVASRAVPASPPHRLGCPVRDPPFLNGPLQCAPALLCSTAASSGSLGAVPWLPGHAVLLCPQYRAVPLLRGQCSLSDYSAHVCQRLLLSAEPIY